MDAHKKLFRKLSKKNRIALRGVINDLLAGKLQSNVKKLKGSDFYRLRKRKFRIIFHYTKSGVIEIDSIRLRDKDTYKDV